MREQMKVKKEEKESEVVFSKESSVERKSEEGSQTKKIERIVKKKLIKDYD